MVAFLNAQLMDVIILLKSLRSHGDLMSFVVVSVRDLLIRRSYGVILKNVIIIH